MIYAVIIIVALVGVVWLCAVLKDGRKFRAEMRKCHERRVEDYERERLMGERWREHAVTDAQISGGFMDLTFHDGHKARVPLGQDDDTKPYPEVKS